MIGNRIKQARVATGMTQDEVVAALQSQEGLTLTKAGLSKYERGGSNPKPVLMRALARVLGVTADFFLDESQVQVEWLAFRKSAGLNKSQQERIKTVAAAHAEAFVTLRRALEPNRKIGSPNRTHVQTPEDAEKAADALRDRWGLGGQPIESVTTAIEDGGGIVVETGGEEDLFDGLSGWADGATPVVVVSIAVSDDRRRFSLAHELGHLFMDVGDVTGKAEERLAHRFAAAFLVPAATARRELGENRRHLDFRELALLKLKHGLSMQAWIMRCTDLGIIEQSHAGTLFTEMSTRGWRKEEPVKFQGRERPARMRQLTVRALAEGLLSTTQAERLCPGVLQDWVDSHPAVPGSIDARSLMKLPKEERDRLMQQAAALVEDDYRADGGLGGFEALSEEDHRDDSVEG